VHAVTADRKHHAPVAGVFSVSLNDLVPHPVARYPSTDNACAALIAGDGDGAASKGRAPGPRSPIRSAPPLAGPTDAGCAPSSSRRSPSRLGRCPNRGHEHRQTLGPTCSRLFPGWQWRPGGRHHQNSQIRLSTITRGRGPYSRPTPVLRRVRGGQARARSHGAGRCGNPDGHQRPEDQCSRLTGLQKVQLGPHGRRSHRNSELCRRQGTNR
jgi:hypothetical protein